MSITPLAPRTTPEKQALKNYLDRLNSTLRSFGYDGREIKSMPDKKMRTELYRKMETFARKGIAELEKNGYSEKLFTDMEGFQADLAARKEKIYDSDLFQRAYALEKARENRSRAEQLKKDIEARNRVSGLNQKVVDAVEKNEQSLKNAEPIFFANDMNIGEQMAGLFDRLGDKSSFFHINSPSFRGMKNALKQFKNLNDYLNRLASDEEKDHYAYNMQEDTLKSTQDIVEAMQKAHDSAAKYLEEKSKQTREKPSEMRLSRLETAREVMKLTGAYLKAHNALEKNGKAVKDIRDQIGHHSGPHLEFYRKNAQKIELPKVEELKFPTIRRKSAPEKQVQSEKVQEKQQTKEPVAMGAMY